MIYIVEDDAAIRELEQYALQSSGYDVNSFESSEPFWQAMHNAAANDLLAAHLRRHPLRPQKYISHTVSSVAPK